MRRGQLESLSTTMGAVIAILILLLVAAIFASCKLNEGRADVRTSINFDTILAYLQQCQQLGQKNCYCDPPLKVYRSSEKESLSLITYADGLYLDLKKGDTILKHKKITDKSFCNYYYHYPTKAWRKDAKQDFTFRFDAESHLFYLDQEQNICFLPYLIPKDARPQLQSCTTLAQNSIQQEDPPKTLF